VRWYYSDNSRLRLQDEKQALHDCVRAALAETQTAAAADQEAGATGPEGDVDAAVNAQIQHRRNQQVLICCRVTTCQCSDTTQENSTGAALLLSHDLAQKAEICPLEGGLHGGGLLVRSMKLMTCLVAIF